MGLADRAILVAAPLVPWVCGINGFASVVATLLATLLAIHWGQSMVVLAAVLLYALAAWQFPRPGSGTVVGSVRSGAGRLRVGHALLHATRQCEPCQKMR